MYKVNINGDEWVITPAKDKKHKYVAAFGGVRVHFGAYGMGHYHDRFGVYSELDHNNTKRLKAFQSRFRKLYERNKDNPYSGIYWSWRYLW